MQSLREWLSNKKETTWSHTLSMTVFFWLSAVRLIKQHSEIVLGRYSYIVFVGLPGILISLKIFFILSFLRWNGQWYLIPWTCSLRSWTCNSPIWYCVDLIIERTTLLTINRCCNRNSNLARYTRNIFPSCNNLFWYHVSRERTIVWTFHQ